MAEQQADVQLAGEASNPEEQGLYSKFMDRSFGLFVAKTYKDRTFLVEPDESTKTVITDGGEVPIVYYQPVPLGKWKCEYFNSPQQMARLFRHMTLAVVMAVFLAVVSRTVSTAGVYMAIITMVLLYINFFFRYNNIAVFGRPMPRIPYLSDFYFAKLINEMEVPDIEEEPKPSKKKKRGKKKDAQTPQQMPARESEVYKVVPVENIHNGFPSPATILTRWMNNEAEWSTTDLIDASGGLLDVFKVKQLLKNNEDAWNDPDIVDVVAKITNSHPSQWRQTFIQWSNGSK